MSRQTSTFGARVEGIYPLGPILDGAGLNLTVLSNAGRVDFGAIGCREAVPDLHEIAGGFSDAVDELVGLTSGAAGRGRESNGSPAGSAVDRHVNLPEKGASGDVGAAACP
jgi:hypothetical protein